MNISDDFIKFLHDHKQKMKGRNFRRSITLARRQYKNGQYFTHEEVFGKRAV